MQADKILDLCGVLAPYCLLMCKSELAHMQSGAILEVHLRDPETIEDLLTILDRSGETVVARVQHQDRTCLWVQKGRSGPSACRSQPEGASHGCRHTPRHIGAQSPAAPGGCSND
jgi:TusA-related sulfurtransferase